MPQIKHIAVLMLENRAFDHMVGYLQSPTNNINGIDAANPPSCPKDLHDATPVPATCDAVDTTPPFDPGHSVPDVNLQLFFNVSGPPPVGASNRGFVYNYSQQHGVTPAAAPQVMDCFDPKTIPVLTTLAQEFALCTRWHASVPGPTWPNRFFVHCATSKGFIDNSFLHSYDMRTIFENLSATPPCTWKIYSHDFPQSEMLTNLVSNPAFDDNWASIGGFKDDAASNALPNYAFIEPKYTTFLGDANDQHPPHKVSAGEQLIAEVYDAVRNGPGWNDTLLIVTYDEHGGLFDHVPPPVTIAPDENTAQFGFDRLGLRVPAVLISPYISKGRIIDTLFDHTSIPAMVKKTFALPNYLTKRDAQANTFEHVFDLTTPRTDAPLNLSDPPAVEKDEWGDEKAGSAELAGQLSAGQVSSAPASDLQKNLVDLARTSPALPSDRASELDHARPIDTEHDAAVYLRQAAARIRAQRAARKATK